MCQVGRGICQEAFGMRMPFLLVACVRLIGMGTGIGMRVSVRMARIGFRATPLA